MAATADSPNAVSGFIQLRASQVSHTSKDFTMPLGHIGDIATPLVGNSIKSVPATFISYL